MKKHHKQALTFLRVLLGWLFFYAGITKLLDPTWTSAGFLNNAENFSSIFAWFGSPENIGWVDFLNVWGQTLIGAALMLGALTTLASFFGMLLMVLYYLPSLNFPYVEHGLLVDEHIMYLAAFVILIEFRAGQYWGLDDTLKKVYKLKGWWF